MNKHRAQAANRASTPNDEARSSPGPQLTNRRDSSRPGSPRKHTPPTHKKTPSTCNSQHNELNAIGLSPSPHPSSSRPSSRLRTSSFNVASTPALVRFAELIACDMCKKTLVDPRMLPCHHVFCSACLQALITANDDKDDILCPVDRYIMKISPHLGINTFTVDYRTKKLVDVYAGMVEDARSQWLSQHLLGSHSRSISSVDQEDSGNDDDTIFEDTIMNVDITLQRLNEALKDIKHSAAISTRTVNEYFEEINTRLKAEQKRLIDEISQRSSQQIDIVEFEKYRLIETKKSLHDSLIRSTLDLDELTRSFGNDEDTISTAPTLSGDSVCTSSTRRKSCSASILDCHVGQQMIDFNPNKEALVALQEQFSLIGNIVCDFDLRVNLHRDFSLVDEYPIGMVIGEPGGRASSDTIDDASREGRNIFAQPKGVSLHKGGFRVAIANSKANEIVIVSENFQVRHISPATGVIQSLSDVAIGTNGQLYVVDTEGCQVVLLDNNGSFVRSTAIPGGVSMELNRPNGIAIDSNNRVIVSNSLCHEIKIFSPDLKKCFSNITNERSHILQSTQKMSFPCGISTDINDQIYVTDGNNKRIVVFSRDGVLQKEIHSAAFIDPRSVAVSDDGHVMVTDREAKKLFIFDMDGNLVAQCCGIVNSDGNRLSFEQPYGVVVQAVNKIAVSDLDLERLFIL